MRSLISYKPNNGLSLFSDFDKVLDSFFYDTPVWNSRTPAVDIKEEKDKYLLEAELPGLSEKDVDVKVEENLLTISSVKKEENENQKENYLFKERRESSFSRSFVLPKDADVESVAGKYKNGILTIEVKKVPKKQPKKIEIKAK